ncbi:hypothetical protein BUE76_20100 [Cnuella takakiae]|nr:hypothetical protein BUE76_20100 [Cnuella takakiae]
MKAVIARLKWAGKAGGANRFIPNEVLDIRRKMNEKIGISMLLQQFNTQAIAVILEMRTYRTGWANNFRKAGAILILAINTS